MKLIILNEILNYSVEHVNSNSSVLLVLSNKGFLYSFIETFNYTNMFFISIIMFLIYYIYMFFFFFSSLEWDSFFIETEGSMASQLVDFFHLIAMLLIFIVFLITFWLTYILVNNKFKENNNNLKLNYNFKIVSFFYNLINYKKNNFVLSSNFNFLKKKNKYFLDIADSSEYALLESTWTIIPLLFVSSVSYPAVGLEFNLSPDITPGVVVRIYASQWSWTADVETKISPSWMEVSNDDLFFEHSELWNLYVSTLNNDEVFFEGIKNLDFVTLKKSFSIDPWNIASDSLNNKTYYRLLLTDNKIFLPINVPVLIIVTSADVIHSLAIPARFLKMDAIPGRSSKTTMMLKTPGDLYGQCSELCGPFHGFMPICFEGVSYDVFLDKMYE